MDQPSFAVSSFRVKSKASKKPEGLPKTVRETWYSPSKYNYVPWDKSTRFHVDNFLQLTALMGTSAEYNSNLIRKAYNDVLTYSAARDALHYPVGLTKEMCCKRNANSYMIAPRGSKCYFESLNGRSEIQ